MGWLPSALSINQTLLSDMVSNMTTTTIIEVDHEEMISNIHISAANTKMAIIRCCTSVRSGNPNVEGGTHQRNNDTARTMTKRMMRLMCAESSPCGNK